MRRFEEIHSNTYSLGAKYNDDSTAHYLKGLNRPHLFYFIDYSLVASAKSGIGLSGAHRESRLNLNEAFQQLVQAS